MVCVCGMVSGSGAVVKIMVDRSGTSVCGVTRDCGVSVRGMVHEWVCLYEWVGVWCLSGWCG